jgi:hypothetical protein
MGLFDFFADRSKGVGMRTGPDFQEKIGPFGERQRKGQYVEYTEQGRDRGFFSNLFKSSENFAQIQGEKNQKRLK